MGYHTSKTGNGGQLKQVEVVVVSWKRKNSSSSLWILEVWSANDVIMQYSQSAVVTQEQTKTREGNS